MQRKHSPKILVITTPIRPIPTDYPPLGCLSIIKALEKSGFNNTVFYNIDFLRPTFSEAIAQIVKEKPDILGISAVVSTAYEYTKKLSLEIKRLLPETTIILGGNLGASAEILLVKTGVDYICTGEGERTMVDFARCWMTAKEKNDYSNVKGLAYLDENKSMVATPFADRIPEDDVYDIDWSILEEQGQLDYFMPRIKDAPLTNSYDSEPRLLESNRLNKRLLTLPASKGCVARCTFCHRWDAGIRYIPVPVLMERIDFCIKQYNIGFINFADENFGTDRKWLAHFTEEIKKRDLLWRVGGMRVNTVTAESIKKMKEAGCISILYGMESGSQKILDVMEKVTKVEQNYNTLKWMAENNLPTIVQLIIGMPGEDSTTIEETSDFVSYFVQLSRNNSPSSLSINFAQALPGTPLYETGRCQGVIGQTLDDEERYLMMISGRDARDGETYINLTDYPKLVLEKWHFKIQNSARHAYIQKWGLSAYYQIILKSKTTRSDKSEKLEPKVNDTGYFADPARRAAKKIAETSVLPLAQASSETSSALVEDVKGVLFDDRQIPSIRNLIKQKQVGLAPLLHPNFFWKIRSFILIIALFNYFRKFGFKYTFYSLVEYLGWKITHLDSSFKSKLNPKHISLRKLLRKKSTPKILSDNPVMMKFRKGR